MTLLCKMPTAYRLVGCIVLGATILFATVWVATECYWRCRELGAAALLEHDYNATVIAGNRSRQAIDPLELRWGRLFIPVNQVSLCTTNIDTRALEQLKCFRHLESLTLQDCQIDRATLLRLPNWITSLDIVRTDVTTADLRCISTLHELESLRFYETTVLKGDWLRPLRQLNHLKAFVLDNGDLTEGAVESLACMVHLVTLQLSAVRIDAKFGPALARLKELENLVIDEMPFDDAGLTHICALNRLRILFLSKTAISDKGMSTIGRLRNLERLSLQNTSIGDEGLIHLKDLGHLGGLDIRDTRATNASLHTLSSIKSLWTVLVDNTRISPSLEGFIGVLEDGCWFPDEEKKKAMDQFANPSHSDHQAIDW